TNNINITFELVEPEAAESTSDFSCADIVENDVITFGIKGKLVKVDWGDGAINTETSHTYDRSFVMWVHITIIGKISEIYISDAVSGEFLSAGNAKIVNVSIGEGVISLPDKAFSNTGFGSIVIPESIKVMGRQVFLATDRSDVLYLHCKTEKEPTAWAEDWIGLDEEHSYVCWGYIGSGGGYMLGYYYSVTTSGACVENAEKGPSGDLEIPETVEYEGESYPVTTIGPSAFAYFQRYTIKLPKNVTEICCNAFKESKYMNSISFPDGSDLTTIGDEAFAQSKKLKEITIPAKVVTMGHNVFFGTQINTFYIESESEDQPGWAEDWFGDRYEAVKWWGFVDKGTTDDGLFDYIATKHGAYITAYHHKPGTQEVIIPDTVGKGEKATEVKYINNGYLFYRKSDITSVHLPDTLVAINDGMFCECTNLVNVNMPSGLVSIGEQAFYKCTSLEDIDIPNSLVSIGNKAFYECTSLASQFTFPASLESIGAEAFYNCNSLEPYVFSEGLQTIGSCAFNAISNNKISEVIIPESVSTMGTEAIGGKSGLSIYCKAEKKPSDWADVWVDAWTAITCHIYWGYIEKVEDTDTGYSYVKTKNGLYITEYNGDKASGAFSIPDAIDGINVVSIGDGVFSGNEDITSVTLPKSLTNIGNSAFNGCKNLETIEIPSTLENIGDYAFQGCANLESIDLPSSLTNIREGAFRNCSKLATVTLAPSSSLANIGKYAFYGCSKIEGEFVFPSSLTSIGMSAFSNCGNIRVVIPNSVTSIGGHAFSRVSGVVCCEAKEKPEGWDDTWAKDTSGNPVRVYWDATEFGQESDFKFVANKTETQIYDYNNEPTITDLVIPSTLKGKTVVNIGTDSFTDSTFTHVHIPDTVKSIENIAFYNCHNLKEIYIPGGVEKMGNNVFGITFSSAKRVEHIYCEAPTIPEGWDPFWVDTGFPVTWGVQRKQSSDFEYVVVDNNAHIIRYIGNNKEVTIPETLDNIPVTSLGGVFANNLTIEKVTLPNTITSIGCGAFSGCTNLETINLTSYGDSDPLPAATDGVFTDTVQFIVSSVTVRDNLIALGGGWPASEGRYIIQES
ncbi:MAG: leucine-rich repeat domain-containing protein, partial [Bacilli bacterium]|nr:leucine-rich repeat domain-containing protein [Bacilli bacterium]